jgi:hypothetical protein
MDRTRTLNEKLALKILAKEGIGAIWRLHVAAADAYRNGCVTAAAGQHHGDARCSRNPGSRARRCSAGKPRAVAHDGGDACPRTGRRRGRGQQTIRHVSATEGLSTSWGESLNLLNAFKAVSVVP